MASPVRRGGPFAPPRTSVARISECNIDLVDDKTGQPGCVPLRLVFCATCGANGVCEQPLALGWVRCLSSNARPHAFSAGLLTHGDMVATAEYLQLERGAPRHWRPRLSAGPCRSHPPAPSQAAHLLLRHPSNRPIRPLDSIRHGSHSNCHHPSPGHRARRSCRRTREPWSMRAVASCRDCSCPRARPS